MICRRYARIYLTEIPEIMEGKTWPPFRHRKLAVSKECSRTTRTAPHVPRRLLTVKSGD